ncbi:MAG: hypothetical protein IJ690_02145 [Clostridia bacterium]|nr:hypothetical protein [Clostridia bacterium]
MESLQGKHFSITDKKDVNTIIYQVNKTDKKEVLNGAPKFTLERLEFAEELREDASRKTYFVDNPKDEGNQLVMLSFAPDKVVVNMGILQDDRVKISKKSVPVKFDTLYSENEPVYKEFKYTPNLQRPISIIDPETTEEIKPILYFDKETNEVRGKIELQPKKPYFAFEVREDKKYKF